MAPTATLHSYAAGSMNYVWNGTEAVSSPLPWPAAPCAGAPLLEGGYGGITVAGIVASMELVWLHVFQHGTGIVNMSLTGLTTCLPSALSAIKSKSLPRPL